MQTAGVMGNNCIILKDFEASEVSNLLVWWMDPVTDNFYKKSFS